MFKNLLNTKTKKTVAGLLVAGLLALLLNHFGIGFSDIELGALNPTAPEVAP